jgi:hypothetical protein
LWKYNKFQGGEQKGRIKEKGERIEEENRKWSNKKAR